MSTSGRSATDAHNPADAFLIGKRATENEAHDTRAIGDATVMCAAFARYTPDRCADIKPQSVAARPGAT